MKSDQYNESGSRSKKRDRYWSVMLVGDHGRIIPFRRFKGLAISAVVLLAVALAALFVLSILYVAQMQTITELEGRVKNAQAQATKFRDEKDLYLTQLEIVKKEQNPAPEKKAAPPVEEKAAAPPAAKPAGPPPKKAPEKKAAPPKPAPAPVNWAADIRRFKATYLPKQKVLKAEFRIYNTSKPRKALAGRTVVVFKNLDDTPIHWFPVPRVQLTNGEPSGARGQSFKINNYRTVQFRAYGQKAPVKLNAATVFIYSDKGKLLASKDFGFKIDYKPPPEPAAPKTVKKPEKPQAAPAKATPAVKDDGGAAAKPPTVGGPSSGQGASRPAAPAPQTPAASDAVPAGGSTPAGSTNTPRQDRQDATPIADAPDRQTPSRSETPAPPADTTETDVKPKTQGEQQ